MLIRRAIPCLLIVLGLVGLVGCLYLPIPEHSSDWSQKDFRPMIDPHNHSPEIRRGVSTWRSIVALLGTPHSASTERREIIYTYDTHSGLWIYPICFFLTEDHGIYPGTKHQTAVRFIFDANDVLVGWEVAEADGHGRDVIGPRLSNPDATTTFKSAPGPERERTAPTNSPSPQ